MKDIDLLPTWYKRNRRRRVTFRIQYYILAGVFAFLVIWNFGLSKTVRNARADLQYIETRCKDAKHILEEYNRLSSEMDSMRLQKNILDQVDCHLDITNVIAELSHLFDEKVVLTRLNLVSEEINKGDKKGLILASDKKSGKIREKKFKFEVDGFARQPADVAALICRLEESDYFFKVVPAYSRSAQMNRKIDETKSREFEVMEFRLTFYLANFQEEQIEK